MLNKKIFKSKLFSPSKLLKNNFKFYSTPTRKERIEGLLASLNPSFLAVTDYGDEGEANSIDIKIVSEEFKNKSMLQQHRMIQTLIKQEMPNIHSITIKSSSS